MLPNISEAEIEEIKEQNNLISLATNNLEEMKKKGLVSINMARQYLDKGDSVNYQIAKDNAIIMDKQKKAQQEYINVINTMYDDFKILDEHTKERNNAIKQEEEFRKKGDTNKADELAATAHRYSIRIKNNNEGLERLNKKKRMLLKTISSYKTDPKLHTLLSPPKGKIRFAKGIKKSQMFTKTHKRKRKSKARKSKARKSKARKSKRRRKSKKRRTKKH